MRRARQLPPEFDAAVFRTGDALAAGVNSERLRRSDLERPTRGVRAPAGSDDFVSAIAIVMRDDQHFSHVTAARLWGAPLPRAVQDDRRVHVTTVGTLRMRRPGVVAHRAVSAEVRVLNGLRLSAPASAWFECAGVIDRMALVAVGDHMVGRAGLATIDDLRRAIRPGSPHAVAARRAVELVRVGCESPMETWMRIAVIEAGFPEPELNIDVHDATGAFLGRVDLAWPRLRIALEYDGEHHRERDVFQHDQRRDNGFVVNDWTVIHATAADAVRPAVLFERLRQAFVAKGAAL